MTKKKKNTKKKRSDKNDSTEGPLSAMKPETIRSIIGVSLFVLALILVLSALGLAGIAGENMFNGIYYVVGIAYWLLPVLLSIFAWTLIIHSEYEYDAVRSIRTVGAFTFFISALGIIAVIASEDMAGKLGLLLVGPLLTYLDTIATLVILIGVLAISLLLLFDSSLWISLGKKFFGLFRKTHEDTDTEDIETVDTVSDATQAVPQDTPSETKNAETDTEEDEDTSFLSGIKDFGTGSTAKATQKKKADFQLPSTYTPPPLSLLEGDRGKVNVGDTKINTNVIRKTLQHFKIPVEMDEVVVGPTVTRYSLKPAAGVRLSKIVALQSNLELALAASPIRIEAPIPGKSLVGIEVPNTGKSVVGLSGLLKTKEFADEPVPLYITLGKDIAGTAHYANIAKMPHLLVAGTTGSGKSVMIHSIITSLLYRNGPEQLRFIMVDPKRVELTLYDGIPHLLTPVITEAKKCILSLKWAIKEMERRYSVLQEQKKTDISGYHSGVVTPAHEKIEKAKQKGKDVSDMEVPEPMPHIVIIIDELSDIMTSYPKELEGAIVRLAQMSRAVGIHLILSTQRPSAKVITGLIKANIPTRISLKVASLLESRIILDHPGAEKLLGAGDMLYLGANMSTPKRIQSPFLTNEEAEHVVSHIIKHNDAELPEIVDFTNGNGDEDANGSGIPFDRIAEEDDLDEIYEEVRQFVITNRKASTSLIQRKFKVGYGRAARIMDQLEEHGVIAGSDGTNKPREVLDGAGYEYTQEETSYDEEEGDEEHTYE